MLDNLPSELVLMVVDHLDQADVYRLSRTSSWMHQHAVPRLYRLVVLDGLRTSLGRQRQVRAPPTVLHAPTVVHTPSGTKALFRSLASNPQLGRWVEHVCVSSVPPDVPHAELVRLFKLVLPHMDRVRYLQWMPEARMSALPGEVMVLLPDKTRLTEVSGNITRLHRFADLEMPRLRVLRLHGIDNVLGLEHVNLASFPELQHLSVAGSAKVLPVSSRSTSPVRARSSAIRSLFSSPQLRPLSLATLRLENLAVTPEDAETLRRCLHLSLLQHLSIVGCVESGYTWQYPEGFVPLVASECSRMAHLSIDCRLELSLVSTTLRCLSCAPLVLVHVTLYPTPNLLLLVGEAERCLHLLKPHKHRLRQLAISVGPKSTCQLSPSTVSKGLSGMSKLERVSLPTTNETCVSMARLLATCQALQELHLLAPADQPAQHLGTLLLPQPMAPSMLAPDINQQFWSTYAMHGSSQVSTCAGCVYSNGCPFQANARASVRWKQAVEVGAELPQLQQLQVGDEKFRYGAGRVPQMVDTTVEGKADGSWY